MREILFRGKMKDNGEWIYGDLIHRQVWNSSFHVIRTQDSGFENYDDYEVIPETVGQFTGLTDKGGVKVFEGDIFKFNDDAWEKNHTRYGIVHSSRECVNYSVVGFDAEHARYDFIEYKYDDSSVKIILNTNEEICEICFADFISQLEVVGNIHDNPELMEVEE